jgi:hypothetical protein
VAAGTTVLGVGLSLQEEAAELVVMGSPAETQLLLAAAVLAVILVMGGRVAQPLSMVLRGLVVEQGVVLGRLVFLAAAEAAVLASLAKVLAVLAVSITGQTLEA